MKPVSAHLFVFPVHFLNAHDIFMCTFRDHRHMTHMRQTQLNHARCKYRCLFRCVLLNCFASFFSLFSLQTVRHHRQTLFYSSQNIQNQVTQSDVSLISAYRRHNIIYYIHDDGPAWKRMSCDSQRIVVRPTIGTLRLTHCSLLPLPAKANTGSRVCRLLWFRLLNAM